MMTGMMKFANVTGWGIGIRIFGGLLGRLFSHSASPSHRVTSKEDGKKIDGYPNCSALAGSIPIGLVRR
jgi:hypothetical protein